MKPNSFDVKVMQVVKNLRKQKYVKQIHLAEALQTTESTYSKMENGKKAITLGQLSIIASYLETSTSLIINAIEMN